MRRILGLLTALAVACSATTALADCHVPSPRVYKEYMQFRAAASAKVLAVSAGLIADIDGYFAKKYPEGRFKVDPSQLTAAEVAQQQKDVIADNAWLEAKLVELRERSRKAGADDATLSWLAYVDLSLFYETAESKGILRDDLPKLANFKTDEVYAQQKFDAIEQACAASLEKRGYAGRFDIGSRAFFTTCGTIQPSEKIVEGHVEYTHAIIDNYKALTAYQKDHAGWWARLTAL